MLEFLRKEDVGGLDDDQDVDMIESGVQKQTTADGKQIELNCLMRLTDDYLLMTTSKNNAMLFIEKMQKLSQVSSFKFNMKKLKTNFYLNLNKIGCDASTDLKTQNIDTDLCSWIGISIEMKTL